MGSVTIYGASDDLIEVEGDLDEEFTYLERDEEGDLLAFSEGTVVRIKHDSDGVWRITPVATGTAFPAMVQAPVDDEDNYSDRLTLSGPMQFRWVVQGIGVVLAKPAGTMAASS